MWTELSPSWKANSVWKLSFYLNPELWPHSSPGWTLECVQRLQTNHGISINPCLCGGALNVNFLLAHFGARASWHLVPWFPLITTHSFPSRQVISKEDISSGLGDGSWGDWLPFCCLRPLFSTKFPIKLIHGQPGLDCLFLLVSQLLWPLGATLYICFYKES